MGAVERLKQLMQIESHNDISEIQRHLLDTIDGAQLDETGCVYAEKHADSEGPRVILNSHMDVVSPHIEFERDGDVIRGRGACDAKGCLAPMVTAFSRVDPRAGSVAIVVSPDEETTQRGLYEYLSGGIKGDFAIVGEPSSLDVCPSARGHYDLEIELYGESAHGATPESGTNATVYAAEAINRLTDLPRLEDEMLGKNDFTPTIIEGGNRPNQVPEHTRFVVDYRTLPAETRDDAVGVMRDVLDTVACEYDVGSYEGGSSLDSFKTDPDHELVTAFVDHAERVREKKPSIRPFDAATEAAFFAPSMPVVVFGPGAISDGDRPIAHSEREFVPVKEVEMAEKVLTEFLSETLS